MKIVLDTNVLLVSISSKSKLHWIFQKIILGELTLCVTSDILSEYAEIIEQHMGIRTSNAALGLIENLPNINYITSYFKFELLEDKDDNKFVDCAIAANSDYIVTHDKDFNILKNIDFPKIKVIDTVDLEILLFTKK